MTAGKARTIGPRESKSGARIASERTRGHTIGDGVMHGLLMGEICEGFAEITEEGKNIWEVAEAIRIE